MNRRRFLQNLSVTAGAVEVLAAAVPEPSPTPIPEPAPAPDVEGHTLLSEFTLDSVNWKVYEDLRARDGVLTFISSRGGQRILRKTAEATFPDAAPAHLGLSMEQIGLSGADLLADKLLAGGGDPDPEQVRAAAPPLGSATSNNPGMRIGWNTFVGTKEALDTMMVYPAGNTRTYHPVQYFPELTTQAAQKRFEGLLGGWMPAVRKVMPMDGGAYIEVVVFGDVEAHDRFIVQTWHRTARIENGKITKVVYGYSYPEYGPIREAPKADAYYRALLVFADYWDKQVRDMSAVSVPDESWLDMSKHAVAKEIMVRPGGVYPKYGAVDRDYYGQEYDGFQDIFTMSVYTNLEWGRFEPARLIIDNYFTDFVDAKGMPNMRGPGTAQFGMTLSLLAKYYLYTRDVALLKKHRAKIEATAGVLLALHDESLKLPPTADGHGLIHGWSESDACLAPKPETWWQPYYANSAYSARGLRDIAAVWGDINRPLSQEWLNRSKALQKATVDSMLKFVKRDMKPPYMGPMPGANLLPFREALAKERPSPQQWPHRLYAELLQPDVLPYDLANLVVDTMRGYGATTIGVVANVGAARPGARSILGFISYGYALMLLRLDRIEEYLLFLYAHRYHDHTRGSWTAGEVAGITGGTALFCIPAQQTIPLLVRWMLALEDSDEDRLYLGKGLPRQWVYSGKPVKIDQAPTRWGRVNFSMAGNPSAKTMTASVELARQGSPKELHVKMRLPQGSRLENVTVNGKPATVGGPHNDTVIFQTGSEKKFDLAARVV